MNPVAYLETGVLHCDDNLDVLRQFPDECVDLIYLDPPFFSNRFYEVIWGDEAEKRSFEDRWEGDIENYLDWMEPRLDALYRVLKPTGSLYLHCDPNASHYLKVACDLIFGGRRHFRAEIVWKRSSAHSDTKQGRKAPGSIHDTLLFYTKGDNWTWNTIYLPYDPEYVESKYRHIEPGTGRRYRLDNLTAAKPGGEQQFEWHGRRPYPGRHWAYTREKMDQMHEEGRIAFPKKPDGVPEYKRYLDEMPGVPLQDLWTDLDSINARAHERLGFPTQKPESLLARLLRASSNPGDIVLDAFCGCGTTVAVAQQLQRQWIGIDISPRAVEIMKRRVNKLGAAAKVYGLPKSLVELRGMNPRDFQKWIVERVNGHQQRRQSGDMGIDGYEFFERLPIQVKQSERVGRNVVDNFETAIERAGKHKGYIVAFSFTRGAIEEAARARRQREIEVVLVKAEDVVQAGELIDAAARERRPPAVTGVAPDLIGLFKDLKQVAEGLTETPTGRPGKRVTKRRSPQQRLPLG